MEVKYRNQSIYIIGSITLLILSFFVFYYKGIYALDYEGFEYMNFMRFVSALLMIYSIITSTKIEFQDDTVLLKSITSNVKIPISEIKGVSDSMNIMTLLLNNGKQYSLYGFHIKNYKEVRKHLIENLKVKRLPFFKSFPFFIFFIAAFILTTIVHITFMLTGNKDEFKYYLPLKSIAVTEIEGSLIEDSNITVLFGNNQPKYITGKILLKEYPNVTFLYPIKSYKLKDESINFQEGKNALLEDTNIKLKIRKTDYEKIITNDLTFDNPDSRGYVRYYSMSVTDELMLQKCCLKE